MLSCPCILQVHSAETRPRALHSEHIKAYASPCAHVSQQCQSMSPIRSELQQGYCTAPQHGSGLPATERKLKNMTEWGPSTGKQRFSTGFYSLAFAIFYLQNRVLERVHLTCSKHSHFSKLLQAERLLLVLQKHDQNHNLACSLFPLRTSQAACHTSVCNTGAFGYSVTHHLVAVEMIPFPTCLFFFFLFLRIQSSSQIKWFRELLSSQKTTAKNAKMLLALSCQTKSKPHRFSTSLWEHIQLIWNQTDKDVLLELVSFAEGKSHQALTHSHALQPAQLFWSHTTKHTHTHMHYLPLGRSVIVFL